MKNMKRLLIIGLLLLTAACGRHRHDDKQIFRYNESSGIATLDPAFAKDQSVIWPCRQLYNGLVELSTVDEGAEGAQQEAMQVQPSVAKSWTVSADGLTYTFTLRDDVFFHKSPLFGTADSTRRVVAEDFVYSFGRITDPSVASPGAWVLASVAGTEAPDDSTFIVRLKEPFAPFLSLLGMVYCSVVPHEVVEHYKDELLTRTGQLKEKYADRIDMVSTPFLNTEYLGFRMSEFDSPLKDKRIRQAINYGFDREKMMRYLRNGIGQPGTGGMVPCGLPGFDTVSTSYGYHYDPERAASLLAEAGYPGGKGLPPLTLSTTSSYLDLCKYIQQQLGLIGIEVKLDVNPPAALREHISQGKSSWFRGSWIADYPDAENYLQLFYSENRCPAGANYTRYRNPHYDALYRKAKKTPDEQERIALYRQMDSLIMEEAPVMVLYYDQILHFTHKNVSGLQSNAMNALDLRHVRIKN